MIAVFAEFTALDINKHPISFCDLHRLIDSKFSTSTFMKHVSCSSVGFRLLMHCRHMMKEGKRVYDHVSYFHVNFVSNFDPSAARRSPRKGEKRPIYVLNLVIPTRHIDNCLEPAKSAVHIEVGIHYP